MEMEMEFLQKRCFYRESSLKPKVSKKSMLTYFAI